MANARIAAREKLSALYSTGVAVRFGPEGPRFADPKKNKGRFEDDDVLGEDEVEMWIAPPNPHQKDMALREAQASRARALLKVKREENSEEYLTSKAYLADMSFETLIDYMVISDQQERINEAMRQVLGEKEWENFDELRDAMRQYEEAVAHYEETGEGTDPSQDPEWTVLLETEQRYARQVDAKEQELAASAREAMALVSRDELERRAMEKRGEIVGSQAFMSTYEDQMQWYSVRDPDNRSVLFFDSVREMREVDEVIQGAIRRGLGMFINEGSEAKN